MPWKRKIKHKYGAKRTPYKGKKYDSKLEARYAQKLDILKMSGELLFYLEQVPFKLPGNIKYRVDFAEFWQEEVIFTDVKGMMTPMSRDKIKMTEDIYKITINIVTKV